MTMPENLILVIFGASGDLTRRKLIPALYSLEIQNLLPERFAVVGVSRTEMTDEKFRERLTKNAVTWALAFTWEKAAQETMEVVDKI